jgi:hypothetical protein
VGRRLLPVVLVAASAVAQALGYEVASFYLLVAAVPAAAAASLAAFGDLVEHPAVLRLRVETALTGLALASLVAAAAIR